jgi:NNP family nitrate/nitrite transporter-like MFS transporter
LRSLIILTAAFYVNFLCRVVFAPLLPIIEVEFGLGHAQAGTVFLFIASGECFGFFLSGMVSSRLNHRLTVLLSLFALGGVMLTLSQIDAIPSMFALLFLLGMSAGLYLPSGISILTEVTLRDHWGRAMAIHEIAPNLALLTAPLLAEGLIPFLPWRDILSVLGVSAILMGSVFFFFGQGGHQKGTPPNPKALGNILNKRSFWLVATLLALGIGAADGVYAMLPLFLVHEIGFDREFANTVIGFAHISSVVLIFFSGLITDRIGAKRAIALFSVATGILTLLLATVHGSILTPVLVFLQAPAVACFFPPVLVIASSRFPDRSRNVVFSLLMIVAILFGGGILPPWIGYLAGAVSFPFGISFVGFLALGALPLLYCLRAEPNTLG